MFRLLTLATILATASAFAPVSTPISTTSLASDATSTPPPPPAFPTLNGWTFDSTKFCGGLPGNIAPMGNFDPLNFAKGADYLTIKRLREAEVMHSRVAMMAVVGYLAGEAIAPNLGGSIIAPFPVAGAANSHLAQLPSGSFSLFTVAIGVTELIRALVGWQKPSDGFMQVRKDYYPGDIGFDPMGLKPKNPAEFAKMQEKELSNGRLAMFAVAGFCGQELVNNTPILANL